MYVKRLSGCLVLLAFLLAACTGRSPGLKTPTLTSFSGNALTTSLPAPETPTPESTVISAGPLILTLWVPAQFDPANGSAAGQLLQSRLDEFEQSNPGVRLSVRVKAVDGTGGLLESLSSASAAAPAALPDLIALPRPLLETAALRGLLHPYEGLSVELNQPDWFEYARQLGHVQNSTYGLPFAGDAQVFIFPQETPGGPASDWRSVLEMLEPLFFPAADLHAQFTLAQYQAAGGQVQDEQGRPALDVSRLTDVLSFYQQAQQKGVIPEWVANYSDDEKVWGEIMAKRANYAIASAARFLGTLPTGKMIAPIPTRDGVPYTPTTGWVWALSSAHADRQSPSVKLAEFLTEPEFLAQWTQAAGYLPTRPSGLEMWRDPQIRSMIEKLATSSTLQPPADLVKSLGPVLQAAVLQVLNERIDPLTAARTAAESLTPP